MGGGGVGLSELSVVLDCAMVDESVATVFRRIP